LAGFLEELDTAKADHGEWAQLVGEILFNAGTCSYELGDLARAESYFRQSVIILTESRGDDSVATSIAQEGLAATLLAQGNLIEAEELLQQALATRVALLESKNPQILRIHNLLATVAWEEGQLEAAGEQFLEVMAGVRKIHGNIHPQAATTAQNLGNLYIETDSDYLAEIMYRQALFILSTLHNRNHPTMATPLNSLGGISLAANRIDPAEQWYQQALQILETADFVGGLSQVEKTMALTGMGRVYLARGEITQAISYLEQAAESFDRAWIMAGQGSEKATFLDAPHSLLAAALLMNEQPELAWRTLENTRGRLMRLDQVERRMSPQNRAELDSLRRRMLALETRLAASDGDAELKMEWNRCDARLTDLLSLTAGPQLLADDTVTSSLVQSKLGQEEAVVGWLDVQLAGDSTARWVYVLRADREVTWRQLPDQENSQGLIEEFVMQVRSRTPFSSRWRELSHRIWDDRFQPAADLLEGIQYLYAVCSNTMAGVPLDAIGPASGDLLVDQMAIATIPSAKLIATSSSFSKAPLLGNILVIADPPYNEEQAAAQLQDPSGLIVSADLEMNSMMPTGSVLRSALGRNQHALASLPRLKASRLEAQSIAEIFPDSRLLLGLDASEQSLAELAVGDRLAQWRVIHLATHALVDVFAPERSALVLSQVGLPDRQHDVDVSLSCNDGILSAREIRMGWQLDADLVVLSACETGLGRHTQSDGFLGLANAFMATGARNMVASLWKVDDRATLELMKSFYKHLASATDFSPALCLQQAKQELRMVTTESGSQPFDDPSVWASFVLVGGCSGPLAEK